MSNFPEDVEKWLQSNSHDGYLEHLKNSRSEISDQLSDLAIDLRSDLAVLYLEYGSFSVRGWYELNEPRDLAEWTDYAHQELKVPKRFVALTSIEGQGITLYCRETEAVYDVEYGQFEKLVRDKIEPIANNIVEFLRWCRDRDD